MGTMVRNLWTTIFGILSAVGTQGTLGSGTKMPATKQEWGAFLLAMILAAWGVVQKDATTGSKPSA